MATMSTGLSIRNTGTLPASVEGVDLWIVVGEETDNKAFSLIGRNDFGASNPPLPYRLLDGNAVRWLTKKDGHHRRHRARGEDLRPDGDRRTSTGQAGDWGSDRVRGAEGRT
jgi:hypothetical protein